jgi:hypothetical protein
LVQLSDLWLVLKVETKGQTMTELLAILTAFYGCHATVEMRPLSDAEAYKCGRVTAAVQVYFLTKAELAMMLELPVERRKPALVLSLKRFRAWEAANPKTVTALKKPYETKPEKKGTVI